MASQDLHNNILTQSALDLTEITSNTVTEGNIIDTQEYESLEFVIHAGEITDGLYAGHLYHGNESDLADAVAVPLNFHLGVTADASYTEDDDNETRRIGYVGHKRYVQIRINSSSVTSGGYFSAIAILSNPHSAPTPKEIDL